MQDFTNHLFIQSKVFPHLLPFSKSKFNLKSNRVNLVASAIVLLSVFFIYPISGQYSTNWDRKGWTGLDIQMYYDSRWCNLFPHVFIFEIISFLSQLSQKVCLSFTGLGKDSTRFGQISTNCLGSNRILLGLWQGSLSPLPHSYILPYSISSINLYLILSYITLNEFNTSAILPSYSSLVPSRFYSSSLFQFFWIISNSKQRKIS